MSIFSRFYAALIFCSTFLSGKSGKYKKLWSPVKHGLLPISNKIFAHVIKYFIAIDNH
jgi:hypothetical protein